MSLPKVPQHTPNQLTRFVWRTAGLRRRWNRYDRRIWNPLFDEFRQSPRLLRPPSVTTIILEWFPTDFNQVGDFANLNEKLIRFGNALSPTSLFVRRRTLSLGTLFIKSVPSSRRRVVIRNADRVEIAGKELEIIHLSTVRLHTSAVIPLARHLSLFAVFMMN